MTTTTTQSSAMGHFNSNKRKSFSDEEFLTSPLSTCQTRLLSIQHQPVESISQTKKIRLSESDDEMMICENGNETEIESQPTPIPIVKVPQHCNKICDADASPTTFIVRCYCDPYRLNALIPYNSDIY